MRLRPLRANYSGILKKSNKNCQPVEKSGFIGKEVQGDRWNFAYKNRNRSLQARRRPPDPQKAKAMR
jgi:hypothetical protein